MCNWVRILTKRLISPVSKAPFWTDLLSNQHITLPLDFLETTSATIWSLAYDFVSFHGRCESIQKEKKKKRFHISKLCHPLHSTAVYFPHKANAYVNRFTHRKPFHNKLNTTLSGGEKKTAKKWKKDSILISFCHFCEFDSILTIPNSVKKKEKKNKLKEQSETRKEVNLRRRIRKITTGFHEIKKKEEKLQIV